MSAIPSHFPAGGLITRKSDEIARLLASLHSAGKPVRSLVGGNGLTFTSQLLFVDPNHRYIEMAPSSDRAANAALLARPRASFTAEASGWHIEFAAADPRMAELGDAPTITLNFPQVMVSQETRRIEPRLETGEQAILRCLADDHGVASFEGRIIDISSRGIGFLVYHSDITLEPGTVLKGCRIQHDRSTSLTVDLEVRYSTSMKLPDGRVAHRSGCVFLNPTRTVSELIASFNPA